MTYVYYSGDCLLAHLLFHATCLQHLFSVDADGRTYRHEMMYDPELARSPDEVCTQPYEEDEDLGVLLNTELQFSIVRTLDGVVVRHADTFVASQMQVIFSLILQVNTTSVNLTVTCCNPGYVLSDDNKTCIMDRDQTDVILRPERNRKYIYVRVNKYFLVETVLLLS